MLFYINNKTIRLIIVSISLLVISGPIQARVLKSAAEPDYPPLSLVNENGLADGFSVELLRASIKQTGHEINFKVDFWSVIKQELADNKIDVLPLVARGPEREAVFDFSVPFLTLHGAIIVHKDKASLKSIDQIRNLNVGVMKGDAADEYLTHRKDFTKLNRSRTFDDALRMLNNGEIDAVVMQELLAHQLINKNNYDNLIVSKRLADFSQEFSFAVTEGDKKLLSDINEGLAITIANGTYSQLKDKWLGILEEDILQKNINIAIISILITLILAYFLALIWQRSLRLKVTSSTKELTEYKENLELLVNKRTLDLANETAKLIQAQAIARIGNYTWKIKDNLTTWSDNLYHLLGHKPGDFIPSYEKYSDFIHPDDKKSFMQLTGKALKNKSNYSGEYRIIKKDGTLRYILEHGEVKTDSDNNLLMLVGVIQDITEAKQAELALQKQRNFNETVLEAASNIIIILDKDDNIIHFNRAAEELTGFKRDDLIGKAFWDKIIPVKQITEVKNVINKLKSDAAQSMHQIEYYLLTKDDKQRLIEWNNSVILDENNNVSHIMQLGHDITEKKREAIEHERFQRELNQSRKMDALGKLTGGIAHDFNNMLGIICGYNDLAIEDVLQYNNKKLDNYLLQIQKASQRAKELISQMMIFSRNNIDNSQAIHLKPVIEDSLKMMRSVIPSSITINTKLSDDLPKIIMDSIKFHQIIMNLSINAKDALAGSGEINIELKLSTNINEECLSCHRHISGDWVELSFNDNGTGMSDEVIEHIFEPFYTTKEVGKGTGMGMSVLNTITENHNGHILIDSKPGFGTIIRLLFPAVIENSDEENKTPHVLSEDNINGNQRRVLIVDDEPVLASYLSELLGQKNYICITESDSQKAYELFESAPDDYDLVITDQTMPFLTGMDLIKKMRKIRPSLAAILASGYSDTVNKATAEGMNIFYLDKPVAKEVLFDQLQKLQSE